MFVQQRDINTLLIDSWSDIEDEEIKKASVILLVYDVNNNETKRRLDSYWLPKLTELTADKWIPIILVGNKIDIRPNHFDNELEGLITPLIMKFKQIEMGIEWSAKAYLKLIDVIFWAQRAVLFPIAPLQDPITKELMPDFEKALLRIFRMCDKDCDGYLDELEIADINSTVFSTELQSTHIEGLKQFLAQECGEDKYSREDIKKGINFEAFKYLQTIYIKQMKLQMWWMLLEHFGYDENLRVFSKHLVQPQVKHQEAEEKWEGVELTYETVKYLSDLYDNYCNQDGNMYQNDVETLFMTYPKGTPWNIENETKVDNHGWVDKKNWIGLWQKEFSIDYEKAYEMMIYLGYINSFGETIQPKINTRIRSIQKPSKSCVFNWYVVGYSSVGKTSFLEMLVKQKFDEEEKGEYDKINWVVSSIQNNQIDRYLILTKIDHDNIDDTFNDDRMVRYWDCICIMYDGSDASAQYIKDISLKLPNHIPKVVIRAKFDLPSRNLDVPVQEIAEEVKTSQFIEISNKSLPKTKEAVDLILDTAINPSKGLEKSVVEKLSEEFAIQKNREKNKILLLSFSGIVVTSALAYASYKKGWIQGLFKLLQ